MSYPISPPTLSTISPITLQPILTRSSLQSSEIPSLLSRSTAAFSTFRKTALSTRQSIVRTFLSQLESKTEILAKELTQQMGRPIRYTTGEILTAIKRANYLLNLSNTSLSPIPGEAEPGFKRYISKEPLGVILIIFAWNYPYLILFNSLIPAILSGNVVILKPSPQTPTIVEHIKELFESSGLPEDVIQYVHTGSTDILSELISHKDTAQVSFTGSYQGGLAVTQAAIAAKKITLPITLELGGNDPAYVRDDVDIPWAAEQIVDGAVFNSGQSCCAIERVYVHQDNYESFCANILDIVKKNYILGQPEDPTTNLGPVISLAAANRIKSEVQDAINKGATDITPYEIFNAFIKEKNLPETFLPIYILKNCPNDSKIMQTETFGPVISLLSVSSDEEAIRYMNDSDLGLTASIWTRNIEKGEELAKLVEAGTVFVNRSDYPSPDLVWIGWKNSGKGGTLGPSAFDGFVKSKSWHIKEHPKAN